MNNKLSIETLMKWIFMMLAVSMVALTLGARLHLSYSEKLAETVRNGEQVKHSIEKQKLRQQEDIILGRLGPAWRTAAPGERPRMTIVNGDSRLALSISSTAIIASIAEDERYLLLVGLLGLIAAVEISVFISYLLTRPIRRLAWGCREIARGRHVVVPLYNMMPYEFRELTDRFNEMASQLEKWKEVQRQLSRMDRLAALGEMLSGLAHEIRNPLASMRIQIDLLRSEVEASASCEEGASDRDEALEQIGILENEIDRLNSIVTQLLAFVRPNQITIDPTSLDDALPWCVSMFRTQASKRGVTLTVKKVDDNVVVMADREMLRQILMNLLLNAIQAFPQSGGGSAGTITVTTGCDSLTPHESGVLSVSDSGPGIPVEIQHRVFDPFFTTRKEGTGLGLSIVQRIVDGMNGTLTMNSSETGTTFRVFLPLAEAEKRSLEGEVWE